MSHADLPLSLTPFASAAYDIATWGFGPYPHEGRVQDIITGPPPAGWKASGLDRQSYLDLAEPIVRMAAGWIDAAGAVIDPVLQQEWGQTSPRFASSAAVLIHFGRCYDLLDHTCRVMERCCRLLATGGSKDKSPDFWMRELITADLCLDGIAPPARQAAWRDDLRRVDPEQTYRFVDPTHGEKMAGFHNWAVYSSGGEALRELAGLVPASKSFLCGSDFFATYMRPQLARMTDEGMYRDPNNPITYDITTRLQIAVPLAFGLQSPLREPYVELLRRGGLTGLLFCSSDGYVPFGGRSSQFHFQEAMQSALCELEAQRYARSDPRLAGAFKRQAHLGALAIRRWIVGNEQIRHIKNGFPPHSQHGIDSYGQYSVYTLLTASFLGLAAIFADDAIEEAPAPAEIGGVAFRLAADFHKVFASTSGVSIEIDTAADLHHDATGLGRILLAGKPMEMILAMPMSRQPSYRLAPEERSASHDCASGPAWRVADAELILAGLSEGLTSTMAVHEATRETVHLSVRYAHEQSGSSVRESYRLAAGTLRCITEVEVDNAPAEGLCYRLPLLETDGEVRSELTLSAGRLQGSYRGSAYTVEWDAAQIDAAWEEESVCNRNGRYRVLRLSSTTDRIELAIGPA